MKDKYPIRPDIKGRTVILPKRTGFCLWCGKDLSFDKRRISFCKYEHSEDYYKRFVYSESTKRYIFNKDDYKCAHCGFDVREFNKTIEEKYPFIWRDEESLKKRIEYKKSLGFSNNAAYIEIDHIIPIKMGGDPLDPKNQQTLCYPCHKKKTKKDVSQMAVMSRICKAIREYWIKKERVSYLRSFFK